MTVQLTATDRTTAIHPDTGGGGILAAMTRVQACLDGERSGDETAYSVLEQLIALTASRLGFLAAVERRVGGESCLRVLVFGGPDFNHEVASFLESNSPEWMEFPNPQGIFGAVLQSLRPMICNNFATDPRAWDLPPDHPAVDNFALLPLTVGSEVVAVAAVANAPGGYDAALIDAMAPVFGAAGVVVMAALLRTSREVAADTRAELDLRHWALLDSVASPAFRWTLDGAMPLEVNQAYCELLGFASRHEARASCTCRHLFVESKQCRELLARLTRDGSVEGMMVTLHRRTGEVVLVELTATAYPDSGYIEGTLTAVNGSRHH